MYNIKYILFVSKQAFAAMYTYPSLLRSESLKRKEMQ